MELFRALGALVEPPTAALDPLVAALGLPALPSPAVHTELFSFELPPFASIYLGEEGMIGGEARDRIAGFLSALGTTPPAEPDHLTILLSTYAALAEGDDAGSPAEPARRARLAFFHEHLASWLLPYLDRVRDLGGEFYALWAELLGAAMASELSRLGEPPEPPLALRLAGPLADPRRDGAEALLESLLAPVRSGILITRADLRAAAAALDLGYRPGDRRQALRGLLAAEPAGLLRWLAERASRAESSYRRLAAPISVSSFWVDRAGATARLLGELARDSEAPDLP